MSSKLDNKLGLSGQPKGPGLGALLQSAREQEGWSRKDVAARLHIAENYIAYLEGEQFENLPGPAFVRGYIRSYARCLGLSADSWIELYNGQHEEQIKPLKPLISQVQQAKPSDPIMKWASYGMIVMVLALSTVWWRSQGDVSGSANAAVLDSEKNDMSELGSELDDRAFAAIQAKLGSKRQEKLLANVDEVLAKPLNADADSLSLDAEPADVNKLLVQFNKESWIEVKNASQKILFTGVKEAGQRLKLESPIYFDVVIGNAAAVNLSYNSHPVDLSEFVNDRNVAKLRLGQN